MRFTEGGVTVDYNTLSAIDLEYLVALMDATAEAKANA